MVDIIKKSSDEYSRAVKDAVENIERYSKEKIGYKKIIEGVVGEIHKMEAAGQFATGVYNTQSVAPLFGKREVYTRGEQREIAAAPDIKKLGIPVGEEATLRAYGVSTVFAKATERHRPARHLDMREGEAYVCGEAMLKIDRQLRDKIGEIYNSMNDPEWQEMSAEQIVKGGLAIAQLHHARLLFFRSAEYKDVFPELIRTELEATIA